MNMFPDIIKKVPVRDYGINGLIYFSFGAKEK